MSKNNAIVQNATTFVQGIPMKFLAANLDLSHPSLRLAANSTLMKDEWKELDDAVLATARPRLRLVQDLIDAGLVRRLGGLGTTISEYQRASTMEDAEVTMSGVTPVDEGAIDFDLVSVPIPIISKEFRLPLRTLLSSRRNGDGLDTMQVTEATRKVADKVTDLVLNGYATKLGGQSLYGLTNHPNANTDSLSTFATFANIYPAFTGMIDILQADSFYGPYGAYVSRPQYIEMLALNTDESRMALDLVNQIPGLQFVRPIDEAYLSDGTVVVFELSPSVIDLAIAQDMVVVEWESRGGLELHFKVMTALAPRVKADKAGKSGIVVGSNA